MEVKRFSYKRVFMLLLPVIFILIGYYYWKINYEEPKQLVQFELSGLNKVDNVYDVMVGQEVIIIIKTDHQDYMTIGSLEINGTTYE